MGGKEKKTLSLLGINIILSLSTTLLIVLLTSIFYIFKEFELKTLDLRFIFRGSITPHRVVEEIVIVDIDEVSLDILGRFPEWPRSYHAKVIEYLKEGGAKAIGFDIFFIEPQKDFRQDEALAIATSKANKLVSHSFFFSLERTSGAKESSLSLFEKYSLELSKELSQGELMEWRFVALPIRGLLEVSRNIGYANIIPDPDGVVRKIPLVAKFKDEVYLSFPLQVVCNYLGIKKEDIRLELGKLIHLGDKVKIPIDSHSMMLINYIGKRRSFRHIPYHAVLKERVPKEFFNNKIVLIGGSASGLFDVVTTPFGPHFPGVEVHANIIHNILKGNFLKPIDKRIGITTLLSLGLVIGIISTKVRLRWGFISTALLLLSYLGCGVYLFEAKKIWIDFISPTLIIVSVYGVCWSHRYILEEKEKKRIRNIFGRYVSKEVVDELLSSRERLQLGGERRKVSILFCDVRGFTSLAESISAEDLVAILNTYLSEMTQIIFKHKGTLNKFIGDALMAIYGAPILLPDHAKRAVLTAIQMQKEMARLRKEGKIPVDVKIGINTGEVIVGNVGSLERAEYTTIGNAVNIASRLESIAQGGQILITQSTYEEVKDIIEVKELGPIQIRGMTKSLKIYEVVELKKEVGEQRH